MRAAVTVLACGLVLTVLGASQALAASVSIVDFSFQPGSMTIHVGESVTWVNNGQNPHTATSDGGAFDSSPNCPSNVSACLGHGQSYTHTFASAGTFPYHCKVHATMKGTVVVLAASTTPPPTPPATTGGGSTGHPATTAPGSTGPLPNTGAGPWTAPLIGLGTLLVLGGALVLMAARRRRA